MSEDRKVALVTGATRGIGQAIAAELAGAGWFVVGTATSEKGAAVISEALGEQGAGVVLNVADDDSVAEGLKALSAEYGPPLVLVNNAGITRDNLMLRMKAGEWQDVINTHLNSLYRGTKACLKGMTKASWGRVINIASAHGLTASPYKAAYVAAKHGVVGMTKTVALETAEEPITCNAICPGYVLTPLVEAQIPDTMEKYNMGREEVIKKVMLERQPSREFATVEQLGGTVCFLASDAAAQITGTTISVDGGWTAL